MKQVVHKYLLYLKANLSPMTIEYSYSDIRPIELSHNLEQIILNILFIAIVLFVPIHNQQKIF
jgi:hypothetical protein